MKAASSAAELWQATKSLAPLTLGIDEAHAMVCCEWEHKSAFQSGLRHAE